MKFRTLKDRKLQCKTDVRKEKKIMLKREKGL